MSFRVVNKEFFKHASSKRVLGEHPFHSMFNQFARIFFYDAAGRAKTLTTGKTCVVDQLAIIHFFSGHSYFLGIDHDYKISAVCIGCKTRLMFAAQHGGNACYHPSQGLILGINDEPLALEGAFGYRACFVAKGVHLFEILSKKDCKGSFAPMIPKQFAAFFASAFIIH